jgi:EAL domain-containing protein (putative c-di-GMP-specific phosphodiesterase class I)/FixJ family two-component response regulator
MCGPTPHGGESARPSSASDVFAGACVLVVDDSATNVELLRRILARTGAGGVHGVTDARLAVARCLELRPDIVLLDLHMPHLNGQAVLTALRETIAPDEFLPVLMLTSDTSGDARERALDAGANDFLTKPFDRVEVVQRMRNLLSMRAMYAAVQRHNAELLAQLEPQATERRRIAVETARRRARVEAALADGALRMVFQPIVDLTTGRVVAVEALARFDCEPRRPPDVWFAEAQEVGLGATAELAAIDAALASLNDLPADIVLTFNASPMTTLSNALDARLDRVQGDRVVVELTEHDRIDDYEAVLAALEGLRARGVRIAVDDASAGYNGLKQILRLRPDVIKLDGEITHGIDGDPVRRAMATSLMSFAVDTGALIVAEGIETEAELAILRGIGVRWGQGFYLARPGPLPVPTSVAVGSIPAE